MTTTTIITPAEFAVKFPRARNHDMAVAYVVIEHHPRDYGVAVSVDLIAPNHKPVQVGYTNKSQSKRISRFAIIPEGAA